MSNVVYVVDKHGKPLMPTKRFGKYVICLKQVKQLPFPIVRLRFV